MSTPPCEAKNKRTADKDSLRQDFQAVLGQLFDLHVQGVEAHAHFLGTRFAGMQRQLEAVVQTARDASEAVTERLRAFDRGSARRPILTEVPPAVPGLLPGERCATAAANMITHRMTLLLNAIRCICDDLEDSETSTADLLRAIADAVGRQALMLVSESQNINSAAYAAPRSNQPSAIAQADRHWKSHG